MTMPVAMTGIGVINLWMAFLLIPGAFHLHYPPNRIELMYEYPTEPQTIGKVLDSGVKLYLFSFDKVIGFAIAAAFFSQLPNFFTGNINQTQDPEVVLQFLASYGWLFVVFMVVAIIFYNALYYRMNSAVRTPEEDFATALAVGVRKLLPVIGALLLYMLAVTVGMILLIVPGIILSLSLFFYNALIIIDNEGVISSLTTSHRLVWGNWWRTAAVFLIPGVIIMAVFIVLGFIFAIVLGFLGETLSTVGLELTSMIFNALLTPLFIAIVLVQLNDLKLRKQGLDLAARLAK